MLFDVEQAAKCLGTIYNTPTQRSIDLGLFEIKETPINHNSGYISLSKTSKVTGKGQVYFINKFLKVGDLYARNHNAII
ncbi:phage antirepressor KilAC domain-containing protein [Viridibacillus arvi]|nr:phage antirepressor KilAC domain-containing protein [Viridibacillus sp. JNUCC-6]